jgi:two-component system sensor histidine kinase YesM
MIIQTLVENAIKHGISLLATPGFVDVRVQASETCLRIEVRDNGPGFQEPGAKSARGGGGYGLRNIRERLRGYFGEQTTLTIGRDEARDMTLVSIEMPRTPSAAGMGVAL